MTFEEIKEKLNNAGSYEDIENTISLIKDPKLRTQMQEFTNECEWENQDIKLVCIVLIEKFLDPKIDNNQLNELKETKTLPNISKFIYNLGQVDEDDKGIKERAWSVNDYTKDGLGNKIIIVSQNGISNLTAKDIKLSVEQAYPQLSGQITANKKGIWFYLKPIKGLKESKKKSDFDKLSDKISKEYIKKGMSKSKAEEIGNATAAKIARSKKTESEESNKEFTLEDVDKVAEELNLTFDKFTKEELLTGMNIELEHGTKFPETNVTDDDLIMTAKIALAHLNEYSNYYDEDVGLHNFERELEAALSNKEDKVEENKEVTESVISDKRKQQIFDNLIDYVFEHTTDERDFYYSLRDIIGLTNEEMTQLGIDVKSLGINDEDDLEESKELKESDESILRLAKNSIVNGKLPEEIKYKGKTYKQFYVIDSENSGETSDIYYCNMENTPSGDPQESNDYFYLKVALNKTENGYKGIKEIRFAEDLTESKELKESVISDMKKKGLYDYIVNEYYNMDKDKLADIAKEAVYILYNEDKDLIKTYKENLKKYTDIEDDVIEAADGQYMNYLSAHYSELSKSDLKDFAKEALALIMDNNLVDEYIEDLKDNTIWADDEEDLEESDNNRKIKIGSKVYWIGAGNEISAEGEVIDFPVDGRMTIKWDDNEQNTYDITHPNIILADNYDNSVNESEESNKITESNEEEENPYENIKVYMNTWGNYNEYGADAESIKGGWMTPDEALEWLDKQEIQEEEPFINDVDGKLPFEVDEYSNPKQALEQIKDLQSLSEDEAKALSAIMESQNDNYEMCKEILDSGDYIFFPNVSDDDELGHAYVDMVGGVIGVANPEKYINQNEIEEEIRNSLEDLETEYSDEMISELAEEEIENNKNNEEYLDNHFDYEALGRALDMDGYYFADTGAIYVM